MAMHDATSENVSLWRHSFKEYDMNIYLKYENDTFFHIILGDKVIFNEHLPDIKNCFTYVFRNICI